MTGMKGGAMKQQEPRLLVQAGPHLREGVTTPQLMMDVVYALIPCVLAALWLFGVSALLARSKCRRGDAHREGFQPQSRTRRDFT